MILLIWVAVVIAALVIYYRQNYSTFSRNGVKQFTPIPLLGNMANVVFQVEHSSDNMLRLYRSFPGERFVGRYEMSQEMVFIRDIELVKKITIKDFEHFLDHRDVFGSGDSYFSKSLISMKGQDWKDMRSSLSPAFTSSKMRQMLPFITEVGDQMIRSLRKKIKDSKTGDIEVDCKDLTTRYTNDVIASCAFGMKVDSHNDEDNDFYAMGKASATFTFRQQLMLSLMQIVPSIVSQMVFIRDIELVKKITIKDFEHFLDHRDLFGSGDSYFSKSLISMKGQDWKDMRSSLSPAFTSSNMRQMLPFITEVGDQMIRSLRKKIKDSKTGDIEVDCKDLTTRYTNDVIASCAFGMKVDSHNDEDNDFYAMGKASATFTFRQQLMLSLMQIVPSIVSQILRFDLLSNDSQTFFKRLVLGTMEEREKKKILRPDMIHLLMLAKKGKLTYDDVKSSNDDVGFATVEESAVGQKKHNREWSDDDLIAQAVVFFLAGFETVSSGMSFLLYELALNPDVQDRLAQEIKETDAKNGGKLDFNIIQNMVYMDMVVSELLRKWPPVPVLDRVCIKDYNLGKPNDKATKDFIVRKGTAIAIPVNGIHRDPQYFPDPEKFDPERFSEENKHKIQPFSYMPFGVGPRNCIGSRFALSELKALTYQLLQNFVLSPSERTCIPAKLDKSALTVKLAGGDWLRISARK